MKNPRNLSGMSVIEFRAATQKELFAALSKWVGKNRYSVEGVVLNLNEDTGEEYAVVTYA